MSRQFSPVGSDGVRTGVTLWAVPSVAPEEEDLVGSHSGDLHSIAVVEPPERGREFT